MVLSYCHGSAFLHACMLPGMWRSVFYDEEAFLVWIPPDDRPYTGSLFDVVDMLWNDGAEKPVEEITKTLFF